ncbi:MAG: hypothetical protein QHJ73_17460, partial [Armatimonadota bacterium]|nr:hypothetical protein [Armatimonadota bacterium]
VSFTRKSEAGVTVVLDGASDAGRLSEFPALNGALRGRAFRAWAVDLRALCNRYLTHEVDAGEAASVVSWLANPWAKSALAPRSHPGDGGEGPLLRRAQPAHPSALPQKT